jgi:hypothetical protein
MSIHFLFLTNLEDEISVKGGRICNTQVAGKIKIKINEYISTHVLPCIHHHMVITTYEERNFNEVI